MIVNYTDNGWEVITQRAHGLLAAQIAMQWLIKNRPARWTETILAIAEHDDAQIELESDDLLTPQGGPKDFKMKTFDAEHCQRLHDFSMSKSRYIALLSSMHMSFLHNQETETNPEAKRYLEVQAKLQQTWQKDLKITKKEADRIYSMLEWCDALSLLLCQHDIQPEWRIIEIGDGPAKKQHKLMQKANGLLTVKPWPFESEAFGLIVEYRVINQLQFKDSAEFKSQFLKAEIDEKIWQMEK